MRSRGNVMACTMSEALITAGVGWDAATVWGSQLALLYQTYVEIEDGFAGGWGFSLSDIASNLVGAELPTLQHFVPALQSVTPQYQFVPAAWLDVPRLSTTWIDDFNSSTFWLSLNVRSVIPEPIAQQWPDWVALAVGYGVDIDDVSKSAGSSSRSTATSSACCRTGRRRGTGSGRH